MKIIVTGGASGIGKAIADSLLGADFEVVSADMNPNNGALKLDVGDENSWKRLFDQTGPVDGLVNCAGIRTRSMIVDTTVEEFENHLKVNLTGTWLGMRSLFRSHKQGTVASIVNIASVNAVIAVPGQAHYVCLLYTSPSPRD